MKTLSFPSRTVAVLLIALLVFPAWMIAAIRGPELPNPGDVGVSKQDQEQLGLKAMGEVYKQMPILPDSSSVSQYVQSLGRKLQAQIPQQYSWPYQFHVVQEKDINAFALPGGPIFVNVGTILAADNEAMLAGVMAHEMAHVYMQHSIKQMQKSTGPSIIAALGQIAGSMIGGVGGALAQLGGQIGGGVLSMKYSRGDEAQADEVGAIIMYKAGYNPIEMARFFQKLEEEGSSGPQFMSDHPNPGNRVQAVTKEVADWPARQWVSTSPQFTQAHQQAQTVRAYSAQEIQQMAQSGQIRNTSVPAGAGTASGTIGNVSARDVLPSGSFRQFNQGGISIDYPSNWQPMGGQQGAGLTIAPPAGVAQNAVAYGALINGFNPQNATSLDDATRQLVSGLTQSNPGLQVAGNPRNIRVNGVNGRSVDLIGTSPLQAQGGQQVRERDWLVTLPAPDGSVVYMVFVSPEPDFNRMRPSFEHMLKSFRFTQ